jgi:hypothetical protein
MDDLDGANVEIACRNCGYKQGKTVAWVRANRKILCQCGATTDFDSNALVRRASDAAAIRGPASFKSETRRFGKRRPSVR